MRRHRRAWVDHYVNKLRLGDPIPNMDGATKLADITGLQRQRVNEAHAALSSRLRKNVQELL